MTAGLRLFKTPLAHTIANGYQYGVQMTKDETILNNRTHISDSMQMYQRDRQPVKHIYFFYIGSKCQTPSSLAHSFEHV